MAMTSRPWSSKTPLHHHTSTTMFDSWSDGLGCKKTHFHNFPPIFSPVVESLILCVFPDESSFRSGGKRVKIDIKYTLYYEVYTITLPWLAFHNGLNLSFSRVRVDDPCWPHPLEKHIVPELITITIPPHSIIHPWLGYSSERCRVSSLFHS